MILNRHECPFIWINLHAVQVQCWWTMGDMMSLNIMWLVIMELWRCYIYLRMTWILIMMPFRHVVSQIYHMFEIMITMILWLFLLSFVLLWFWWKSKVLAISICLCGLDLRSFLNFSVLNTQPSFAHLKPMSLWSKFLFGIYFFFIKLHYNFRCCIYFLSVLINSL